MKTTPVLETISPADLGAVNALILAAIDTWPMQPAVRARIAPSYRYDQIDLAHMQILMLREQGRITAVMALEAADPTDAPLTPAMLLHGIYVAPALQRCGLGRALVREAGADAVRAGARGLLVKAQRSANGFFERLGFERLPITDPVRDYPHRFWQSLPAP